MRARALLAVGLAAITTGTAACVGPIPLASRRTTDATAGAASGRTASAAPAPAESLGWTRVPLDGTVRAITTTYSDPGVIVVGRGRNRHAFVATVHGTQGREVAWDLGGVRGADGLESVLSDGENVFLGTGTARVGGAAPEIWYSDLISAYPELMRFAPDDVPHGRLGQVPVWTEPSMDGEGDYRVAGLTPTAHGSLELNVWFPDEQASPVVQGHLYLHGAVPDPDLHLGAMEVDVVAAGRLSRNPAVAPEHDSLWEAPADPYEPGGWEEVPLSPRPDSITDISASDVGYLVAGVRGGKPVVYDDDAATPDFPALDTTLDRRTPTVLFASETPFASERPALATQSADGPTFWVASAGHYTGLRAPSGHLDAAAAHGDMAYLVIDGALWARSVPTLRAPSEP